MSLQDFVDLALGLATLGILVLLYKLVKDSYTEAMKGIKDFRKTCGTIQEVVKPLFSEKNASEAGRHLSDNVRRGIADGLSKGIVEGIKFLAEKAEQNNSKKDSAPSFSKPRL